MARHHGAKMRRGMRTVRRGAAFLPHDPDEKRPLPRRQRKNSARQKPKSPKMRINLRQTPDSAPHPRMRTSPRQASTLSGSVLDDMRMRNGIIDACFSCFAAGRKAPRGAGSKFVAVAVVGTLSGSTSLSFHSAVGWGKTDNAAFDALCEALMNRGYSKEQPDQIIHSSARSVDITRIF